MEMMSKNIREYRDRVSKEMESLKAEVIAEIEKIPDNPKIKWISKVPRCFTMLWSDIGDTWSPQSHDNLWQAEKIAEKLRGCKSAEDLLRVLERDIVYRGYIIMSGKEKVVLNAEVRAYVRGML